MSRKYEAPFLEELVLEDVMDTSDNTAGDSFDDDWDSEEEWDSENNADFGN